MKRLQNCAMHNKISQYIVSQIEIMYSQFEKIQVLSKKKAVRNLTTELREETQFHCAVRYIVLFIKAVNKKVNKNLTTKLFFRILA